MSDSWINARASIISGNAEPSAEALAQATAEYDAGGNLVRPENFDPAVPTEERLKYGPALPCAWHGYKTGCKHGNDCHSSHGLVGVAACFETLAERKARLDSEAVNGVPLLNVLNRPQKRKPCRYLRREGGCNKADACTYSHEKTPCKFFFSTEGCEKADGCEFSHVKEACRHFFRRGGCKNGDKCTFNHDLPAVPEKVNECAYFPSGCANGPSCAYNAAGDECSALVA